MTSELLTYATLAERERVYDGRRWLREWRRAGVADKFEAAATRTPAAAKTDDLPNRCPSPETRMAASR